MPKTGAGDLTLYKYTASTALVRPALTNLTINELALLLLTNTA